MRRLLTAAVVSTIALAGFSVEYLAKKLPGGTQQATSVIEKSREGAILPLKGLPKKVEFKSANTARPLNAHLKEGAEEVSKELVNPSLEIIRTSEDWYMSGTDWYTQARFKKTVRVAFDGDTIYIRELVADSDLDEFSDVWIAGIIHGNNILFPALTYCGTLYDVEDIYFTHLDLTEDGYFNGFDCPEAKYDAESGVITFLNDCCLNYGSEEGMYMYGTGIAAGSTIQHEMPDPGSCETGAPVEIPYFNDFGSRERFYEFGTIDANEDNNTWEIMAYRAQYNDYDEDADDWLVSPAMYFEKGKTYRVAAKATKSVVEHEVSFWLGKESKVDAMTQMLLKEPITAQFGWEEIEYQTLQNENVTVEESGYYHVGIYIEGPTDPLYFTIIDDFSVELLDGYPEPVSDVILTPDASGENEASLMFIAPSNMRDGEPITADKVQIYINDEHALDVMPGDIGFHMLTVDKPGEHTFDIVAAVDDKKSPAVTVTRYIGVDTPEAISGFVPTAVADGIDFAWNPASSVGVNGSYTRPDEIRYNIWTVIDPSQGYGYYQLDENISGDIAESEWHYKTDIINMGDQGEHLYGITAKNSAGESEGILSSVFYGKPYDLPYKESFTGHTMWSKIMFSYNGTEDPSIYYCNNSSDNDDTGIEIDLKEACEFGLKLGKISLESADTPYFVVDLSAEIPAAATVKAATPDNEEVELSTFTVSEGKYNREVIDLAKVASCPWVRITVYLKVDEAEGGVVYIDNLNVLDLRSDNLSVELEALHNVTVGTHVPVSVSVTNIGKNDASGYKVALMADGNILKEWEGEPLSLLDKAVFEYTYIPNVFTQIGEKTLTATVEYAADKEDSDNKAASTVTINKSTKPSVTDLSGSLTENGVSLSWKAPEATNDMVTLDFEDYDICIKTDGEKLGEWTARDLDQGFTAGFASSSVNWPWNNGEEYAFGIVDITNMGFVDFNEANSGDKALMFMSVYLQDPDDPEMFYGLAADKWLISPELSGEAISLSFAACPLTDYYGPEILEIMISDTDSDPASFKVLETLSILDPIWDEYYFDIPAGTKYFALHYVSNDVFALFIDDISYGSGSSEATGYNVYADQNLVAKLGNGETSFEYPLEISDKVVMSVTADYNGQESMPESITLTMTGIDQLLESGMPFDVYSIDGVCVKTDATSLEGLIPGVYIIGNKKVIIK